MASVSEFHDRGLTGVRALAAGWVLLFHLNSIVGPRVIAIHPFGVEVELHPLITIGWNDRMSSFKARNGETGRFWTDWFNGGSSWPFCCNSQVSGLGAYDNTFSSVQRT